MRNTGSVNIQLLGESFCLNGQGKKLPQTDSGESRRPQAKWVAPGGRHMSLSTLAGVEMRWRKHPREILFSIKRKNSMYGKLSYGRDARWILEHSKLIRAVLWVCLWGRSCFSSYSLSLFICVPRIKSNLSLDPCSALVSTAAPKMMGQSGEVAPDIRWGRQSQSLHTKHCRGHNWLGTTRSTNVSRSTDCPKLSS